jgi:hypothetical protein
LSNNKLQINGLAELREQLRNLPDDLAQEAGVVVTAHAEDAQRRVQNAYPEGPTGNLKRRVTVNREVSSSRFGAKALVSSRAPHAWLFENGVRGKAPRRETPANEQAIPIFVQVRRRMVEALIQVVQKAGLTVTAS